jgi:hypothetical protein
LPEAAWLTVEVRDGEKGPLAAPAAWGLVQARTEGRPSDVAEVLVAFRERQGDGTWKHDYLPSNAPLRTPVAEFARVFKAEHRIETDHPHSTSSRRWAGTGLRAYHQRCSAA